MENKKLKSLLSADTDIRYFKILQQTTEYLLNNAWLIIDLIQIIIEYMNKEPLIIGELSNKIKNDNICAGRTNSISTVFDGLHIYFTNTRIGEIYVIDTKGNTVKSMGKTGPNNGEFQVPRGLFINGTYIYIADRDNRRIQIFSIPEGQFINKIQFEYSCNGVNIYKSLLYVSFTRLQAIGEYTLGGTLRRFINYSEIMRTCYDCLLQFQIFDDCIYIASDGPNIGCIPLNNDYGYLFKGEDYGGEKFERATCTLITDISLYIADNEKIQQFDRTNNNNFVRVFGKGIFKWLGSIVFINDKLYAFDRYDGCIYIIS